MTPRRDTSYVEPTGRIAKDGRSRIELNGGVGNYCLRRVMHNAPKRRTAGLGSGYSRDKEDKRGCKTRKVNASAIRRELSVGDLIRGLWKFNHIKRPRDRVFSLQVEPYLFENSMSSIALFD